MTFGFGFCSFLYGVRFSSGSCTFLLLGSGLVQFLTKPEFWFGSFLLGLGSFPSLVCSCHFCKGADITFFVPLLYHQLILSSEIMQQLQLILYVDVHCHDI